MQATENLYARRVITLNSLIRPALFYGNLISYHAYVRLQSFPTQVVLSCIPRLAMTIEKQD